MATPSKLFLHDFPSNPERFPPWTSLPLATEDDVAATSSSSPPGQFLVAQITENMTITKPTLILLDREADNLALTFDSDSFSLKGWKKGYTVVVPGPRRMASKEEGKKGFVKIPEERCGEARCVPGAMERVVLLAVRGYGMEEGEEVSEKNCGWCKEKEEEGKGKKCLGCGWVRYCSKVTCPPFLAPLMLEVLCANVMAAMSG